MSIQVILSLWALFSIFLVLLVLFIMCAVMLFDSLLRMVDYILRVIQVGVLK
jgi:hypothetical protein